MANDALARRLMGLKDALENHKDRNLFKGDMRDEELAQEADAANMPIRAKEYRTGTSVPYDSSAYDEEVRKSEKKRK